MYQINIKNVINYQRQPAGLNNAGHSRLRDRLDAWFKITNYSIERTIV